MPEDFSGNQPITQGIDAVKALLAYVGRASDPLPTEVTLDNGRMVLVLSNKKDAYYTCTAAACSCPAATYHAGPCKHHRKYFPQQEAAKPVPNDEPLIERGGFKPFSTVPGEKKAVA